MYFCVLEHRRFDGYLNDTEHKLIGEIFFSPKFRIFVLGVNNLEMPARTGGYA